MRTAIRLLGIAAVSAFVPMSSQTRFGSLRPFDARQKGSSFVRTAVPKCSQPTNYEEYMRSRNAPENGARAQPAPAPGPGQGQVAPTSGGTVTGEDKMMALQRELLQATSAVAKVFTGIPEPAPQSASRRGVPLTGQTLQAALKIRCDLTGAAYAVYWAKVGDVFEPVGTHIATTAADGFVSATKGFRLDVLGDGIIATCKRTMQPAFVANVQNSNLRRKEIAYKTGVTQIGVQPFEDGVIEIGNMGSSPQWTAMPAAPIMPKPQLRKAFSQLGAKYAIVWLLDASGSVLTVAADYESPDDKKTTGLLRGDGQTFTKLSKSLRLNAHGQGPVAQALQRNEEITVTFADGVDEEVCASMRRAEAAKEFGICSITFVPVIDDDTGLMGVLEYGTSNLAQLNQVALDATLSMQAESSGAGYAIYWRRDGQKVCGSARTPDSVVTILDGWRASFCCVTGNC